MRPPPPDRGSGYIYGNGQARPLEPTTAGLSDVTAGFQSTPAFGMFLGQVLRPAAPEPPVQHPRWWDDARRLFTVLGMVAAVAILLGAGLYLVVQAVCPCTLGAQPVQPEPAPVVSFNASQYDPITCGSEGTP